MHDRTWSAAAAGGVAGCCHGRFVDGSICRNCMSSEHFGQFAWQFKRMSGSSGLKVQRTRGQQMSVFICGEKFQGATASGGRDGLARVAARVAYQGHCRCLRDGDAQVEPRRVRTPGRSTPGLGHPQPFPLDAGDEWRDAGKFGRRVNRGRDPRNGVAKQPGAILCRHSNVLDCPAETVPQAVEI